MTSAPCVSRLFQNVAVSTDVGLAATLVRSNVAVSTDVGLTATLDMLSVMMDMLIVMIIFSHI
jgi:hypothetical protein